MDKKASVEKIIAEYVCSKDKTDVLFLDTGTPGAGMSMSGTMLAWGTVMWLADRNGQSFELWRKYYPNNLPTSPRLACPFSTLHMCPPLEDPFQRMRNRGPITIITVQEPVMAGQKLGGTPDKRRPLR